MSEVKNKQTSEYININIYFLGCYAIYLSIIRNANYLKSDYRLFSLLDKENNRVLKNVLILHFL